MLHVKGSRLAGGFPISGGFETRLYGEGGNLRVFSSVARDSGWLPASRERRTSVSPRVVSDRATFPISAPLDSRLRGNDGWEIGLTNAGTLGTANIVFVPRTKWGPELRVERPVGVCRAPPRATREHLVQLIHIHDVCGAGEPHPKGDACVAPTS